MTSPQQQALIISLSPERFKPYLNEARQYFSDHDEINQKALELYEWATELAGLFQIQISYLEVALRNALSREISTWNNAQTGNSQWTRSNRETNLDQVINSRKIQQAIRETKNDKGQSYTPNQHDIIAKLTFGFWSSVINHEETDPTKFHWLNNAEALAKATTNNNRNNCRDLLWASSLEKAFPHRNKSAVLANDRAQIAKQIHSIHQLRNRISHHDNILKVHYPKRLNEIYGLLGSIGGSELTEGSLFPPLREQIKTDPRKQWCAPISASEIY